MGLFFFFFNVHVLPKIHISFLILPFDHWIKMYALELKACNQSLILLIFCLSELLKKEKKCDEKL